MTMPKTLWLDDYERSARLAPGLIALLPLPILVTAFGLKHNPVTAILVSVAIAVGGPLVLAKYIRSRGRTLEKQLFEEWSGPPTTLLLTPASSGTIDAVQAQRRANVERVSRQTLPSTPLPNDSAAQQVYSAAVSTLRQKTYSHTAFPLIFAENKSYGFERNTLAIRTEGLALSIIGLVVAGAGCGLAATGHLNANFSALLVAAIVIILLVIFWVLWPTKRRVRDAGDLYAQQLLDAASNL
jgi:Flp pilus assembly protein TadB